jgi:O-methyltransferase
MKVKEYLGRRVPHAIANVLFMARNVRGSYFRDGLFTTHDAPFRRDPVFREAYRLGRATGSWGTWEPEWRAFTFCWAARHALQVEGDLVECGVYRGGYSRAVAHYIDLDSTGKKLWLVDTFDGLVDAQITDEERARGIAAGGNYTGAFERAKQTFSGVENARLLKGSVPEVLGEVGAERVAYLSLDMNCLAPELAAAEFFWPRMPPGAVLVLDDYGWRKYKAQQEGFDRFASEHGVQVLALPNGQGLIFKT